MHGIPQFSGANSLVLQMYAHIRLTAKSPIRHVFSAQNTYLVHDRLHLKGHV
jgi:hypothetical protein